MRDLRTMELLRGPAETWRKQLEHYYQKKPVFALLGGISTREWAPIHRFCEDHGIPAIFPITDYPVISESDWYTLYLSKAFQDAWVSLGHEPPHTAVLKRHEPLGPSFWKTLDRKQEPTHVLLWLNARDFPELIKKSEWVIY